MCTNIKMFESFIKSQRLSCFITISLAVLLKSVVLEPNELISLTSFFKTKGNNIQKQTDFKEDKHLTGYFGSSHFFEKLKKTNDKSKPQQHIEQQEKKSSKNTPNLKFFNFSRIKTTTSTSKSDMAKENTTVSHSHPQTTMPHTVEPRSVTQQKSSDVKLPNNIFAFRSSHEELSKCLKMCDGDLNSDTAPYKAIEKRDKENSVEAFVDCSVKCVSEYDSRSNILSSNKINETSASDSKRLWETFRETIHLDKILKLLGVATIVTILISLCKIFKVFQRLRILLHNVGWWSSQQREPLGNQTQGNNGFAKWNVVADCINYAMYEAGKIAVYVLSAKYLPVAAAEFIPWADLETKDIETNYSKAAFVRLQDCENEEISRYSLTNSKNIRRFD